MNNLSGILMAVVFIGIGATLVMDVWLLALKRAGVPTLNFAMLGRWVGHLAHGRFRHDAIAKAAPVRHETLLGWTAHYATGLAFAALMAVLGGPGWIAHPELMPALAVGLGTIVLPFFVMQPAMGAGIASSRTPTPLRNGVKSLANHTVFGLGLYIAATVFAHLFPVTA